MKANPRKRSSIFPTLSLTALCAAMLVSGCVPAPRAPAPVFRPAPAPAPSPPAPPPSARDWRDAPATPGDWQWNSAPGQSSASFAGGQFVMRCDPAQHTVTLLRALPGTSGQAPMSITTTATTRALTANPVGNGVAVTLSAHDPLLDAMAFSRGRFAVEVAGAPPLYVPSWTEVSRVIEDCR